MAIPPPNVHGENKILVSPLKDQIEPTVIHRAQFKGRPNIITFEKVDSVSSSPTSSMLGSVVPRIGDSTEKTSLDSKHTSVGQSVGHGSSENKKLSIGGSIEHALTPISEGVSDPVPTVVTVENAAAAKIFFECHYNNITSGLSTPRSMRRRKLESALYQNQDLSQAEREWARQEWIVKESDHLRETRLLKTRASNALKGKDITKCYELVKILGKGSFGVVRLVREKGE